VQSRIKEFMPQFIYVIARHLVRYHRIFSAYFYDCNRFYKNSTSLEANNKSKLHSQIMLDTHVIEKGLTMPEFRYGFGQERLIKLIGNIRLYKKFNYSVDVHIQHAEEVVAEYYKIHNEHISQLDDSTLQELKLFINEGSFGSEVLEQTRISSEEYFSQVNMDFYAFSKSRSSVRNYSSEEVELDVLNKVLELAQNYPSACNRQAVRVHLYMDKAKIEQILKIQGGNRGFGHLSKYLILISFDSSVYFEDLERNIGYVDGGIYSLNLLYALHYYRLGACILNASNNKKKDQALRDACEIPESEVFVSFITGGKLPSEFQIALSKRYPIKDVVEYH